MKRPKHGKWKRRREARQIRELFDQAVTMLAEAVPDEALDDVGNDDFFDDRDRCEICHSIIDHCDNHHGDCAMCHMPGCSRCLEDWDDVFPELCSECAYGLRG